jgi:hypothetical protein
MEHIGKLLQTATASPSPSSTPQSPTVPRAWALGFSERMRSLFRESWTAKWSTAAEFEQLLADYSIVLSRLTPDQIAFGIDKCLGRSFPPNPSEFYGLASQYEAPRPERPVPCNPLPALSAPEERKAKIALLKSVISGRAA